VYEGLTDYLGDVLAARSKLWTNENFAIHRDGRRRAGQHAGRNCALWPIHVAAQCFMTPARRGHRAAQHGFLCRRGVYLVWRLM